jgi:putative membrane protein
MLPAAINAGFHYLGFMVMFSTLVLEHLMIKPELTRQQASTLLKVDGLYGLMATIVLGTGLARLFVFDKPLEFYTGNPVFHLKMTLFVAAGLLSIYPTVTFLKWRKQLRGDGSNQHHGNIAIPSARRLLMVVRLELLLVLCIPFAAALMARGIGGH